MSEITEHLGLHLSLLLRRAIETDRPLQGKQELKNQPYQELLTGLWGCGWAISVYRDAVDGLGIRERGERAAKT
jgi:hypothetical protein